jgi:hypothetical protein
VISGNNWYGVEFVNVGTSNNLMVGNIVGLNAAGTAALGNSGGGVSFFDGASNNTLGRRTSRCSQYHCQATQVQASISPTTIQPATGSKATTSALAATASTVFGNSGHGVHILDTAPTTSSVPIMMESMTPVSGT